MSHSYADAPEVLRSQVLLPLVELAEEQFFHQFPLQSFFGPAIRKSKNEFVVHLRERLRILGSYHAERAPGDRRVLSRWDKMIFSCFFQQESFEVSDHDLHYLGMAGQAGLSMRDENALAEAQRQVISDIFDRLELIMRTNEYAAAQILQGSSPSLTVDGVTDSLAFGVVTNTAAADWNVAGTDIITEFDKWLGEFRQSSGAYPDVILVSDAFWRNYIRVNTDILAFMQRNPEFINDQLPMQNFSRPDREMRFEVMTVPRQYENSSGTMVDFWTADIMTFLRVKSGSRSLQRYTVTDQNNAGRGGTYSYVYRSMNPIKTEGVVNDATMFSIVEKNDVEVFDLVA